MRAELERPIFDGAFWSSILHSRTFWVPQDHGALLGTFVIAMMLLASMLLLPRLSARRRRISELHGDISGSTTMMDFVLVTPVFVFFMFVVFQFTILAKNHLFTHYAAYAAARSARVYFCPAFPITLRSIIDVKTCDDDAAAGKADLAARLALIPAAPYDQLKCVGACQPPEDALKSLADASGLSKNWRAMRNQARYMFDPQNVTVTVDRAPMALYAAINRSPHVPVTAKVEARFLLLEYAGWVFARGQRKDGRYYTISTAEVNLL
ncbi:TadE/TadG family type IV pilus assembly protein [Rhizobium leguminosarum]|uniref:TadE/TadG family type IV pilus assembly protein n=1 Tax=Rhizobium leguminosarum TaxID=384 RepID=UPI0010378BDE|nr:TadE/TadG family type IV pilus assembly protein [Rhizobium leguminosarum]TBF89529.1 hypothetical protein ELG85_30810 [Rhizobium leguminosarum]